ncbi:hypothetical protein [Saccharibacillus sacchari]|uniref:hypothetical protein n=1 Tax=Saccharibacillus sacchari TaxID=456493 RepID=UPI000568D341|nr:hypothetical protein [Saccharibacillus sacchari]
MGFLKKIFFMRRYESLAPIIKRGKDIFNIEGDYVILEMLKDQDNDYRKEWFIPSDKIILGLSRSKEKNGKGCKANWEFDLNPMKNGRVVRAELNIKTSRSNAGLHTSKKLALEALHEVKEKKRKLPRYAKININKSEVDTIVLLSKMNSQLLDSDFPEGLESYKDFGFNKINSYDLVPYLKEVRKEDKLLLTVEVDEIVYWDIDSILIENIVLEKYELNQFFWMILGAVISAAIGVIASLFLL